MASPCAVTEPVLSYCSPGLAARPKVNWARPWNPAGIPISSRRVTGRDVVEPPPGGQEGLRDHIRRVVGVAGAAQHVPEQRRMADRVDILKTPLPPVRGDRLPVTQD